MSAAVLLVAAALAAGPATAAKAHGDGSRVERVNGPCYVGSASGGRWWASCKIVMVFGSNGSVIVQHISGKVTQKGPDGKVSDAVPSKPVLDFAGWPCFVLNGKKLATARAGVLTPGGQLHLVCTR